jgi:folate-dependent phosphoribosylglycinamide formyltransferase PurN
MQKSRPWITFHSHTGSEIREIIERLDIKPDISCTNNPETQTVQAELQVYKKVWKEEDYLEVLNRYEFPLVTLHGWMRILPAYVCETFEIYNGHPALCNTYPELKGKDMQAAVINRVDKYPHIGSIVHRCTPELDSGEVLEEERVHNISVLNEKLIYDVLRDTSLKTWLRFLQKHL